MADYFPAESKAKMEQLVANLRTALSNRIDNLTWMSDETKVQAHDKLAKFTVKIGYPERWRDYSDLEMRLRRPVRQWPSARPLFAGTSSVTG